MYCLTLNNNRIAPADTALGRLRQICSFGLDAKAVANAFDNVHSFVQGNEDSYSVVLRYLQEEDSYGIFPDNSSIFRKTPCSHLLLVADWYGEVAAGLPPKAVIATGKRNRQAHYAARRKGFDKKIYDIGLPRLIILKPDQFIDLFSQNARLRWNYRNEREAYLHCDFISPNLETPPLKERFIAEGEQVTDL